MHTWTQLTDIDTLPRQNTHQQNCTTITLINNKGGVGKTTCAVNIAAGLALQGYLTLLVDLDSQSSASFSLGVARDELVPSIANVLLNESPIQRTMRATNTEKLDLLTGSVELSYAEVVMANNPRREYLLQERLHVLRPYYDYIIIDCPPSTSLITINALIAADEFIIPLTPHYLAFEGLANFLNLIETIERRALHIASSLGIVLTMVDGRSKDTKENIQLIRERYPGIVFEAEIPINVRLAEAPALGQTIFEHDPNSKGAIRYWQLVHEIVDRCRMKRAYVAKNYTYGRRFQ